MKKNEHLPLIGVGPLIVIPQLLITIIAIVVSKIFLQDYQMDYLVIRLIVGICIIALGIGLWIMAMFKSKIDANIAENNLVTTGVYGIVRNPIYSAFFLVCVGAIIINGIWLLLILPFLFWGYMTIFLKKTEEVWLKDLYGTEYEGYCKKVNRCIPWFSKSVQ